jgi:F0F1-type ATP synthase epsilon subunit
LYIEGGFMEVKDDKIVLIVDGVEWGDELDAEALKKRMSETEKRIQSSFRGEITPDELARELDRQRVLRLKLDIVRKATATKKA